MMKLPRVGVWRACFQSKPLIYFWLALWVQALFCVVPARGEQAPPPLAGLIELDALKDQFPPGGFVKVHGERLRAVFDSGFGSQMVITKQTAHRMKMKVTPSNLQAIDGTTALTLEPMKDGGASRRLDSMVLDTPFDAKLDVMFGWQVLREMVWEMDYPGRRQVIHERVPDEVADNWESYPIADDAFGGVLTIMVPGADKPIPLIIDTGASCGAYMSPELWRAWIREAKPSWFTFDSVYSPGTRGGFVVTPKTAVKSFKIGELELGTIQVSMNFANMLVDGRGIKIPYMLGTGAFSRRRVVIDGPGGRVYFGPFTAPAPGVEKINRAQATFKPTRPDGSKLIAKVVPDGVAYKAGLRDADELISIDGEPIPGFVGLDPEDDKNTFRSAPGTRLLVVVRRDGEQLEIPVVLGRSPLDPDEDAQGP